MPVTGDILERQRDLAAQDAALKQESSEDVLFMDMTKRPPPITVYAMADGEPILMPPWIARMAMGKRYSDGRYLFTTDKAKAPTYKLGKHKCFLHAESTERQSGLLEAAGVWQTPGHFGPVEAKEGNPEHLWVFEPAAVPGWGPQDGSGASAGAGGI